MPASGRTPPPPTEAASSVPTKGPTHANEASENVSPISSVPAKPPFSEDRFKRVRMEDGMVISNAPSRLNPKAMNSAAINPLTHGFAPSCATPKGPSIAVTRSPRPENSTTMPRQKTTAWITPSRRPPDCRFRKYDMVMGIIGNTQGVKIEASPNPNASTKKAAQPCADGAGDCPAPGGGPLPPGYPAGMVPPARAVGSNAI